MKRNQTRRNKTYKKRSIKIDDDDGCDEETAAEGEIERKRMKEREHEKDQFKHSLSPLAAARVMNGKF